MLHRICHAVKCVLTYVKQLIEIQHVHLLHVAIFLLCCASNRSKIGCAYNREWGQMATASMLKVAAC